MTRLSFQNLHDPLRYELQIDKIFNRMKDRNGVASLFESRFEEVSWYSFGSDKQELARRLASSIRNETYVLSPAVLRLVKTKNKNKKRLLYELNPMDKIVVSVIAAFLTEVLQNCLNPNVFSYRKGVSAVDEVKALSRFIKEKLANPQCSGVYFMQTDIASYSDEINVQDNSPFWTILADYFEKLHLKPTPYHWYLIKKCVRPEYFNLDGCLTVNLKGAPTGSPISTVLFNYYVSRVDFYFTYEPTLFYARYSDDIILCHEDAEILESSQEYFDAYLKFLAIRLSKEKTKRYYINPAGKKCTNTNWKGQSKVQVLGYSVDAKGNYILSFKRQNKFLKKIFFRIKNTLKIMKDSSWDDQGPVVCQVINTIVENYIRNRQNFEALCCSTDLSQLKHIDYQIALMIAKAMTKESGPRAFRIIPYKKIRGEWGLSSLLVLRHLSGKKALQNV